MGAFQQDAFQNDAFDVDATGTVSGSFTANAVLRRERTGSFTARAVIRRTGTGSFTADAILGQAFTANAVIKGATAHLFTADAYLLAHSFTARAVIVGPTPPPGTKTSIVIKVNGVDITDDVIINTAQFTQAVNARPGQFAIDVKDDDHIYQFVSGGRVTLDVDGYRNFDGYITMATVKYAFPVDITTDPSETPRLWHLAGPDLNILFAKRIVFDQSNPNADFPLYPAGSSDRTVILDHIRDYLDLTGDDITTDGVTSVGSPNPDFEGYMVNRGSTWGQFMGEVAQLPGAVWGLSQYRDLFYEDSNTENAPFVLSDTPDQVTSFGYSHFSWNDDGTRLANDVQVWGAGTGSTVPVFSEVEDATSIADHGRWQLPNQFRSDMYRQTTVNHVAESIVYGSDQNLHGMKDPYIVITCRLKKHGLRAGMKVRFINTVHGLDQVFPIRRLTIRFVNRYDIFYELDLTREIDEPWYFAEFAPYPRPGGHRPPKVKPPRRVRVPPREENCITLIQTFDNFNRTSDVNPPDLGIATPSGYVWTPASPPIGTTTILGLDGAHWFQRMMSAVGPIFSINFNKLAAGRNDLSDLWAPTIWSMRVRFRMTTTPISTGGATAASVMFFGPFSGSKTMLYVDMNNDTGSIQIANGGYSAPGGAGRVFSKTDWVGNTWYIGELLYDTVNERVKARIYVDGSTPPAYQLDSSSPLLPRLGVPGHFSDFGFLTDTSGTHTTAELQVDNIEFQNEVCGIYWPQQVCFNDTLDGFDRTETDGWGKTEAYNLPWVMSDPAYASVDGFKGVLTVPSTAQTKAHISSSYLWSGSFNLQQRFEFTSMPGGGFFPPFLDYGFTIETSDGELSLGKVQISPTDGPLPNPFTWSRIQGLGGSTAIPNGFWSAGALYVLEIDVSGTSVTTSVYNIASPGTVYTAPVGVIAGGRTSELSLVVSYTGGSATNDILTSYIDLNTCYFLSGPPAARAGTWGCQQAASISPSVYQLAYVFVAGTTEVYLNGRLLRLTYDYSENPTEKTITLVAATQEGDVVYVCYTAGGVP